MTITTYTTDCDPVVWRSAVPLLGDKDRRIANAIADGVERDGVYVLNRPAYRLNGVDHPPYQITYRRIPPRVSVRRADQ